MNDFIKPYSGFGKFQGPSEKCSWTSTIDSSNRCHVAVRGWFNLTDEVACTKPEAYGYIRGFPCIALKMNRIYGWEPEPYYNTTDVEQNHPEIPQSVKGAMAHTEAKYCKNVDKCPQLRMVWIDCHGATPHDEEYMGPVTYMPIQGYPGFFFPFLGQQHYLSPVVWIQLEKVYPGVLITIECKLYAKNIRHDPSNPMVGGVRIELLMD